ncbi:UPF0528 protein [Blattella germanica]|nr:UPF0528 protein [Blattella germanica]
MSIWHIIVLFIEIMSFNEAVFPSTLHGFGYAFNKDGELRKIDPKTGEPGNDPFEFNVSEDPEYNQKSYEALGDVITEYLYDLLETEVGLQKLRVPKQGSTSESTFVFATPDIHNNPERLLVLIHGSGAVKAGQWARSLIINDNIKSGSQIPYIKKAKELGYAVLVMNTNDNTRVVNGKLIKIKGSRNANEHADYVWKHYVKQMNPKHVAIVAHSYGGLITVNLASQYYSDFRNSVFAIAFTDSVHNIKLQKTPSKVTDYLQKVSHFLL